MSSHKMDCDSRTDFLSSTSFTRPANLAAMDCGRAIFMNLPSFMVPFVMIGICMLVTNIVCVLVWCVCCRNMRRLTATPEYQAFKQLFSDLQMGIQSPEVLACKLYSSGIIDNTVREKTKLASLTVLEKNGFMLTAVEQAISSDPQLFHQFIKVLGDEPTNQIFQKMLLDAYYTFAQSTSYTHTTLSAAASKISPQDDSTLPSQTFDSTLSGTPPADTFSVASAKISSQDDSTLPALPFDSTSSWTPPADTLSAAVAKTSPRDDSTLPAKPFDSSWTTQADALSAASAVAKRSPQDDSTLPVQFFDSTFSWIPQAEVKFMKAKLTKAVPKLFRIFKNSLKSTSDNYQVKLTTLQTSYYQHNSVNELHENVSSWIASGDKLTRDMKIFMGIKFSMYEFSVSKFQEIIELCQCSHQNGFLLKAYACMTYAYIHSYQGDHEKASVLIDRAKISCLQAAPSYLTCWVFYADAVIQARTHEKDLTPSVKEEIIDLFDFAIAHSYFCEGWERSMICFCHIRKTLFLLGGTTMWLDFNPNYRPTEEDMLWAEKHLKYGLPSKLMNEFSKMTHITVEYYVALSDFNRLRGETVTAREHAKTAKKLYADIGESDQGIEDRLLYRDPFDNILCQKNMHTSHDD